MCWRAQQEAVIDGNAHHDRHEWRTVMNGMHDGEVLLHFLVDLFFRLLLSCFKMHIPVWDPYWLQLIFYNYKLQFKVSLQRLLFLKQHLLLCEGYTPGHLTLGASIVLENLLAITSHLVHVMDKSLLIVNFKYVVSAVPDTSCELLPLCKTRTYSYMHEGLCADLWRFKLCSQLLQLLLSENPCILHA